MTLRTIFGIGWSAVVALAGGWLVLSPWALNEQGGGSWTTVTKVSVGTGLGLLAFAVIGLAVVGIQIALLLRPEREPAPEVEPALEQANLERALVQLATKLVADLDREPAAVAVPASPSPTVQAPAQPVGVTNPATNGMTSPQSATTPPSGDAPAQEIWKRTER